MTLPDPSPHKPLSRNQALAILGLKTDATEDATKKAYKQLSRLHHPDGQQPDADIFKNVSRAYVLLTDPVALASAPKDKTPQEAFADKVKSFTENKQLAVAALMKVLRGKAENPDENIAYLTPRLREKFPGMPRDIAIDVVVGLGSKEAAHDEHSDLHAALRAFGAPLRHLTVPPAPIGHDMLPPETKERIKKEHKLKVKNFSAFERDRTHFMFSIVESTDSELMQLIDNYSIEGTRRLSAPYAMSHHYLAAGFKLRGALRNDRYYGELVKLVGQKELWSLAPVGDGAAVKQPAFDASKAPNPGFEDFDLADTKQHFYKQALVLLDRTSNENTSAITEATEDKGYSAADKGKLIVLDKRMTERLQDVVPAEIAQEAAYGNYIAKRARSPKQRPFGK